MSTYRIYKTDTRKSTKSYPSKETIDFFSTATYILETLVKKFLSKHTDGCILEYTNKTFRYEFSSGDTFELILIAV